MYAHVWVGVCVCVYLVYVIRARVWCLRSVVIVGIRTCVCVLDASEILLRESAYIYSIQSRVLYCLLA